MGNIDNLKDNSSRLTPVIFSFITYRFVNDFEKPLKCNSSWDLLGVREFKVLKLKLIL